MRRINDLGDLVTVLCVGQAEMVTDGMEPDEIYEPFIDPDVLRYLILSIARETEMEQDVETLASLATAFDAGFRIARFAFDDELERQFQL